MGIKIIKGGTNQPDTKPMSEMKPLEVAEVITADAELDAGDVIVNLGDDMAANGIRIHHLLVLTANEMVATTNMATIVRPLTEPITIEISNDTPTKSRLGEMG